MTFGCTVWWTTFSRRSCQVTVEGASTREDAFELCLQAATALGWKPVRWWQFWRRQDWNRINRKQWLEMRSKWKESTAMVPIGSVVRMKVRPSVG